MYKNNSRDSSKFKGCSLLQLHRKLKVNRSAIGYYSYTKSLLTIKPFLQAAFFSLKSSRWLNPSATHKSIMIVSMTQR